MSHIEKNQENIQNNIQAKISFRKDMKTLKMNLPGIDKSLKGYGYKYQNFNEIVREIKNVINKHNLELDFEQFPTFTHDPYGRVHVVRTTFYSTISGYEESFDTPILTENLQWNNENGSKSVNTTPQLVGSAITYFKRYALVACLNIESEVDTDSAPIYNNYENGNSMPNKQVNINQEQKQKKEQKQEINQIQKNNTIQNQKRDINQEQKKDRLYYYGVFKEALSNIKNWVNSAKTKDNINLIIQKISFIQKIDPNNVDDIKKIEADLIAHFEKNSDFKSINYWAEIIKDYFKRNNRLKDLQDFEKFMAFKRTSYGPSPLLFFCTLKEDKQFDYIFAA
ncbi:single-stranded DNA-binding protein (plasmid) [Borreliella garinii]|uniref:ERF family protein n=2 Tax=Borreliella TaxID=64895 RepID=UPI000941A5E7|nr:ERF family protein [Borreliella garinii]APQ15719.1 single-stranded DNA-binding protein [Borreliella garinii]AZA28490.1 single-stranded DNA-binding protein [Borreliella garinii]WVN14749.1 ERF family protein [Borreliella valaisiana]